MIDDYHCVFFLCQGEEISGRHRFYSLYNEATHLIAHINHNITDITLDLNDPLESRLLHLGELPISQAGLATVAQGTANGNDMGRRFLARTSRSIGRRVKHNDFRFISI